MKSLDTKRFIRSPGASDGFTLIEVVFALAIMTLAFSSILAVESGSINATTRAKQMNIVGMLAKNQMVELEYKVQGLKFTEVQKEQTGKFDSPYDSYSWKTTVKEINFPNLMGMSGAKAAEEKRGGLGSPGNSPMGADQMSQAVSRFFSNALREITVTVLWKQGTKEQSYSISTFWVDLNADFNPLLQ